MPRRLRVRVTGPDKPLLDRRRYLFSEADADQTAWRERIAITNEVHGIGGRDDFALLVSTQERQSGVFDHRASPAASSTWAKSGLRDYAPSPVHRSQPSISRIVISR